MWSFYINKDENEELEVYLVIAATDHCWPRHKTIQHPGFRFSQWARCPLIYMGGRCTLADWYTLILIMDIWIMDQFFHFHPDTRHSTERVDCKLIWWKPQSRSFQAMLVWAQSIFSLGHFLIRNSNCLCNIIMGLRNLSMLHRNATVSWIKDRKVKF